MAPSAGMAPTGTEVAAAAAAAAFIKFEAPTPCCISIAAVGCKLGAAATLATTEAAETAVVGGGRGGGVGFTKTKLG